MSSWRRTVMFAAIVGTACGGSTESSAPSATSINILSGDHQTDTVGAHLHDLISLEVRTYDGPAPHTGLRVAVRPIYAGAAQYPASVGALYRLAEGPTLTLESDAVGQAQFHVQLGDFPGPVIIDICIVKNQLCNVVTFSVRHGNPAQLSLTPRESWQMVGSGSSVVAWAVDRLGNILSDEVDVTAATSGVRLSQHQVIGVTPGRQRIAARVGTLVDTVDTWVVPVGRLAAPRENGIAVFNTDGTDQRVVVSADPSLEVYWSPEGDSLVYVPLLKAPGLKLTSLSGVVRSATTPPLILGMVVGPQFTRDGQWIYFGYDSSGSNGRFRLWRARRDGGVLESVPGTEQDPSIRPSPSPDGNRLVFAAANVLTVLDLRTGERHQFGPSFYVVRWSPVSEEIAYLTGGWLVIMNADGTNRREIGPQGYGFGEGLDWSPDGRWLVNRTGSGRLVLVEAATGLLIPLPIFAGSVSWRQH